MFIVLSSVEIITLEIVCSIVNISIFLSTRWLAAICHKLSYYNWYVHSVVRMADMLEMALESIFNGGRFFIDKDFIMGGI